MLLRLATATKTAAIPAPIGMANQIHMSPSAIDVQRRDA
jgi:hypothetical protein